MFESKISLSQWETISTPISWSVELLTAISEGREAVVAGFVETARIQGKLSFLVISSRFGGTCQAVGFGPMAKEMEKITPGSWVELFGTPRQDQRAPGGIELSVKRIGRFSPCAERPVLEGSSEELWLERPSLRTRRKEIACALEVRELLLSSCRKWLSERGFLEICTPKLMGSPSESGSEVFEVKYFEGKAYLAQSPQFYKQLAILGGQERIFEVGPVFRAEKSFSPRHSTEFQGLDVELSGVEKPEELACLEAAMLRHALSEFFASPLHSRASILFPGMIESVPEFEILEWKEALTIAQEKCDLSSAGESRLGAAMKEKGVGLVAVTGMPWEMRPFYHMKKGSESLSFEMIFMGTEITTGAIREHRHPILMEQVLQKGLTGKGMEFYLEAFQWGAPPHGGFGLGVERLVRLTLGLQSIREVCMIARTPSRIVP